MNKKVLDYISEVRRQTEKLNLKPDEVFLNGNCGNLYYLLVNEFSKTHKIIPCLIFCREEPMHMVTEVDGELYDITGITSLEKYIKFLKDHTSPLYREEDFKLKRLEDLEEREYYTSRMINMYRYNEDYEQSEVQEEMDRLEKRMKDYTREREI